MLDDKDLKILSHLRSNSRKSVTEISKAVGMPVTTVFDRIRSREQDVIERYTCLLNFKRLGFHTNARIALKVAMKDDFEEYITKHPAVNSVEKIDMGYDYMIHVVFKDIEGLRGFLEDIDRFGIEEKRVYHVIDDVEKEKVFAIKNK